MTKHRRNYNNIYHLCFCLLLNASTGIETKAELTKRTKKSTKLTFTLKDLLDCCGFGWSRFIMLFMFSSCRYSSFFFLPSLLLFFLHRKEHHADCVRYNYNHYHVLKQRGNILDILISGAYYFSVSYKTLT